jgi:hypothetical protein
MQEQMSQIVFVVIEWTIFEILRTSADDGGAQGRVRKRIGESVLKRLGRRSGNARADAIPVRIPAHGIHARATSLVPWRPGLIQALQRQRHCFCTATRGTGKMLG